MARDAKKHVPVYIHTTHPWIYLWYKLNVHYGFRVSLHPRARRRIAPLLFRACAYKTRERLSLPPPSSSPLLGSNSKRDKLQCSVYCVVLWMYVLLTFPFKCISVYINYRFISIYHRLHMYKCVWNCDNASEIRHEKNIIQKVDSLYLFSFMTMEKWYKYLINTTKFYAVIACKHQYRWF